MTRLWLLLVALGIVMLIAGYAAAAEITGPRWQLWEQPPGQEWRPRGKQLGMVRNIQGQHQCLVIAIGSCL